MQRLNVISCCRPLGAPSLSDEEAAGVSSALPRPGGSGSRKIVNLLATSDEPVCACEFEPALELSQPTVSHHLKKLTEAGLLERDQRGKWAYFSLKPEASSQLERLVRITEVV